MLVKNTKPQRLDSLFIIVQGSDKGEEMKFNWELIMQENTVVHCDTEEKAIEITKEAHSRGEKWYSNRSYLDETWYDVFKKNTCYQFLGGFYMSKNFAERKNMKILSFEEVLLDEKEL